MHPQDGALDHYYAGAALAELSLRPASRNGWPAGMWPVPTYAAGSRTECMPNSRSCGMSADLRT